MMKRITAVHPACGDIPQANSPGGQSACTVVVIHHSDAPTCEQLLRDYYELKKELGRAPLAAEYEKRCHSRHDLRKAFGSSPWKRLRTAAGERPRYASFLTQSMLLREYHALKEKLGRLPKHAEYVKECYSASIIIRKFGIPGWRRLLEAAGDKPRRVESSLTASHLIKDFLDLQKKLSRRPTLSEYTHQCHTPKVLDRVFGSPGWRRMIEFLGDRAKPGNILNAEHLIQDYLETKKTFGCKFSYRRFHARHGHSLKVLVRVFGKPGWSNLQKAAAKPRRAKRWQAEKKEQKPLPRDI